MKKLITSTLLIVIAIATLQLTTGCAVETATASAEEVLGATLAQKVLVNYNPAAIDALKQLKDVLPKLPYKDQVGPRELGQLNARLRPYINAAKQDGTLDNQQLSWLDKIGGGLAAARDALPDRPTEQGILAGHFTQVAKGIAVQLEYSAGQHDITDPPAIAQAKTRRAARVGP